MRDERDAVVVVVVEEEVFDVHSRYSCLLNVLCFSFSSHKLNRLRPSHFAHSKSNNDIPHSRRSQHNNGASDERPE